MGGGKQGQYPAWWKGKWTIPPITNFTSSSLTIDGVINPGGHFALSATLNDEVDKLVEENKSVLQKVALAASQVLPSISSCSFADSGCTTHFFKSQDVFANYKPLERMAGQSSKEGASFLILGIGDVEIKVVFNNVENTLTFCNALHAPNITTNLLSISKMDVVGWHAMFRDQRVCFY